MKFLNYNEIVNNSNNNKLFPQLYLEKIFNYFNNNNLQINCDHPLSAIKCFIPLPSKLLLNEIYKNENLIIYENNKYKFHGSNGNIILFSDILLPFNNINIINNDVIINNYPIPFAFPIYTIKNKLLNIKNINNSYIDILLSNVYYYEVTLLPEKNINNLLENEYISLGFGNKNVSLNSNLGIVSDSIGFYSNNGNI
jgi:hypothetical protein